MKHVFKTLMEISANSVTNIDIPNAIRERADMKFNVPVLGKEDILRLASLTNSKSIKDINILGNGRVVTIHVMFKK